VTLAKVNIDTLSEVAVQLSVSSIPAVFAIYKKETVSKCVFPQYPSWQLLIDQDSTF